MGGRRAIGSDIDLGQGVTGEGSNLGGSVVSNPCWKWVLFDNEQDQTLGGGNESTRYRQEFIGTPVPLAVVLKTGAVRTTEAWLLHRLYPWLFNSEPTTGETTITLFMTLTHGYVLVRDSLRPLPFQSLQALFLRPIAIRR